MQAIRPKLKYVLPDEQSGFYHPQEMSAINREGDIFFFNSNLAGICLNEIAGCQNPGQVCLGDIKNFQE